MILDYHSDGGHGWIKVEEKELINLGLAGLVTRYSYTDGVYVYLEEDLDATRFFSTLKEKGIEYKTKSIYDGDHSPIRDLARYVYRDKSLDKTN